MLTLIFILICILVAFTATVTCVAYHKNINLENKICLTSILIVGMLIVAIMWNALAISLKVTVGDTSEFIVRISDTSQESTSYNLYYDNSEDRYFITKVNLWDITNIHYREYLNSELVEEYLTHHNAMNEISLFDTKN